MERDELRREAIAFSRYLVDRDPPEDLIARYIEANAIVFPDAPAADDRVMLEFVRRHPWAIAMLDASAALTAGRSRFRQKLLVMMAILETTPAFAERTAQRAVTLPRLGARLAVAGVSATFHLAAGLALSTALRLRHAR